MLWSALPSFLLHAHLTFAPLGCESQCRDRRQRGVVAVAGIWPCSPARCAAAEVIVPAGAAQRVHCPARPGHPHRHHPPHRPSRPEGPRPLRRPMPVVAIADPIANAPHG